MNRRESFTLILGPLLCGARSSGVEKARAKPTPGQIEWHDMELEMFLCLDPCTWQNREYDNHSTPLERINPAKLDTDQWADVAVSMGVGQIVFVAKHTGGFCWWQTRTSNYGVKEIPWRSGKGDVVRMLSDSCRQRGLKLGIYLSPQDRVHGAGLGGRCQTHEAQASYARVYRRQLTELLSRYRSVSEVWFDGSSVIDVGDILRRYAPEAMVFQSRYATIRWVGNENGVAPYPAWNAVSMEAALSGIATSKDGDPDGDVWLPNECDARIRSTWFWNEHNAHTLKSLDELMQMYYRSVGHGAVLLLNNTPDTSGLIPRPDVKRSDEFGAEIRRRFQKSTAETKGQGHSIELAFPQPAVIDHAVAMEQIAGGERVREYAVEAFTDGGWREICRGTAIGHKRIDPFKPVIVSRLRLRTIRAAGEPLIRKFAAYDVGAAPSGPLPLSHTYAYRTVKEWSPQDLSSGETIWDIDLTPYCREAGQYEIDFVRTGGRSGLKVHSLSLRHGKSEAPEFIRAAGRSNVYRLNLTAVGVSLVLRVTVSGNRNTDTYGQVMIRQVPQ